MKIKIRNNIINILFLFFVFFSLSFCDQNNEKRLLKNNNITVKVFSSLTCPHCASFHENVVLKIKNDSEINNVVKFEHIGFPLNLQALNAEKVLQCSKNQEKKDKLLTHLYKKQNNWASQSDINDINESLKNIGKTYGLSITELDMCLKDENLEEKILEKLLNAQKEYKINSTPTIFINDKKYKGDHKFKDFKKEIEKLL